MQEQLLKLYKKWYVVKSKIKTIHKRWKHFKYKPFYEICPSCGMYLCNGGLNENDEICCQFCGCTKIPERFKKTVNVAAIKCGKRVFDILNEEAEKRGLPLLNFMLNPEFISAFDKAMSENGEPKDG